MKRMIFTSLNPDKQLENFKCTQEEKARISELLDANYNVVRIESEPGNGSSHVLMALANQMKRKGERLSYVEFQSDQKFNDLHAYHIKEMLQANRLFIDNIHFLTDEHSIREISEFLKSYAEGEGTLYYSSTNCGDAKETQLIADCFNGEKCTLTLNAQSDEIREKWMLELIGRTFEPVELLHEIFTSKTSNRDFLKALNPFIHDHKLRKGTDHSFNRTFEDTIHEIRLELRKEQLLLAHLQIDKTTSIRGQYYEKAADIREIERAIFDKIDQLKKHLLDHVASIPFTSGLLRLHFMSLTLLNEFEANNLAVNELNSRIDERIVQLEGRWEELKRSNETRSNKEVNDELVGWKHAMEQFHAQLPRRKMG